MDRNTYAPWNVLAFRGEELYQKLRGPLRSKYSIGKALLVSVVLSGALLVAAMGMSVYIRLPWWTDRLLLLLAVVFQYALAPAFLRSWAEDKDQARLSPRMKQRLGNPMFIWCADIIQT